MFYLSRKKDEKLFAFNNFHVVHTYMYLFKHKKTLLIGQSSYDDKCCFMKYKKFDLY